MPEMRAESDYYGATSWKFWIGPGVTVIVALPVPVAPVTVQVWVAIGFIWILPLMEPEPRFPVQL